MNTVLRYASLTRGPCLVYLTKADEALRKCEEMLDFLLNYVPQLLPSGVREWYLSAVGAKARELLSVSQPQGSREG